MYDSVQLLLMLHYKGFPQHGPYTCYCNAVWTVVMSQQSICNENCSVNDMFTVRHTFKTFQQI